MGTAEGRAVPHPGQADIVHVHRGARDLGETVRTRRARPDATGRAAHGSGVWNKRGSGARVSVALVSRPPPGNPARFCLVHLREGLLDGVSPGSYLGPMRAIALRDLQEKLGEYVHLAESGERVLITDRDRVVAELVPPREDRSPWSGDSPLSDAIQRGWITPPASRNRPLPLPSPIAPLSEILAELAKDREDR